MAKEKFFESKVIGWMVGHSGGPSTILAPGERVRFDPNSDSHVFLAEQLEAGAEPYASLGKLVEIDPKAEEAAEKEKQEQLEKAAKLAAKAEAEEIKAAQVAAGEGIYDPTEHNVKDVLDYLAGQSEEEVKRVQELEAASDRDSVMIANYEPQGGGA